MFPTNQKNAVSPFTPGFESIKAGGRNFFQYPNKSDSCILDMETKSPTWSTEISPTNGRVINQEYMDGKFTNVQEDDSEPWLPEPFGAFSDKSIRKKFIRKVYGILSVQLSFTIVLGIVFLSVSDIKEYFRFRPLFAIGSLLLAFVPLLILTCFPSCRRNFPVNFLLLTIFSVLQGFAIATLTCAFDNQVVLVAFGMCTIAVFTVSGLSLLPCIDVTQCGSLLLALLLAQLFMGLGMMTMVQFFGVSMQPLHIVYAICGSILSMLFLAYDTQVILGGRKYELSPEEYIFGAITLYMDILNIFLYLLQLVSMTMGGGGSRAGGG